ncbi:unnamed protein product [Parnassius mnemosyne]|uniref:Uncharacterized protein n=1 Tax=Parnassius mnemosyne TaxID=213953 RepID=A0AAV1KJJ7_9NEOP
MACQPKRSETVVIHELLAFVQQKLDVMDQVSLEQILMTSFTEDEIIQAKKVLADLAVTQIRLITRHRDGRGKKDLQDIFRLFNETDPDDIPTFVARDLNKLPPVTFDHVDVTRLLKDITTLRADITDIRSKFEESERAATELRNEVNMLRNIIATFANSPPSQNVNTTRGNRNSSHISPMIATPSRDTVCQRVDDRETRATSVVIASPSQPLTEPIGTPPPKPTSKQGKTFADVARKSLQPAPSCGRKRKNVEIKSVPVVTQDKIDKDGFTLVEKRRRSRPVCNQRRTAKINASTTLRVVEPTIQLYISRLDKSTSEEDVLRFVEERSRCRIEDPISLHLQRLESNRSTNFKSYVLQVPAKHKETFLAPDFWPSGIINRPYGSLLQTNIASISVALPHSKIP